MVIAEVPRDGVVAVKQDMPEERQDFRQQHE
jgi:hypothetical protein